MKEKKKQNKKPQDFPQVIFLSSVHCQQWTRQEQADQASPISFCLLPMPQTYERVRWDGNTHHCFTMLPMLPEVSDGTYSFLKRNSLLLHVLQESVSAKILTHSSWNLCKLLLAAALRGYSPQSLTSVQFSTCAVQHISNKSDQNCLDGAEHCEHCNRGSSAHWNIPVRCGTSVLPPDEGNSLSRESAP